EEFAGGARDQRIRGVREGWDFGLDDPTCADIDVAALHAGCLAAFRRAGGELLTSSPLPSANRRVDSCHFCLADRIVTAGTMVNAAGAWADDVAKRCGIRPLHVQPYRRTIVQLRVG